MKTSTTRISDIGFDVAVVPTLAAFGYLVRPEENVINHYSIKTDNAIIRVKASTTHTKCLEPFLKDNTLGSIHASFDGIGNYYFYFIDKQSAERTVKRIGKFAKGKYYVSLAIDTISFVWNMHRSEILKLWQKVKVKNKLTNAESVGIGSTELLTEAYSKEVLSAISQLESLGISIGSQGDSQWHIKIPAYSFSAIDLEKAGSFKFSEHSFKKTVSKLIYLDPDFAYSDFKRFAEKYNCDIIEPEDNSPMFPETLLYDQENRHCGTMRKLGAIGMASNDLLVWVAKEMTGDSRDTILGDKATDSILESTETREQMFKFYSRAWI